MEALDEWYEDSIRIGSGKLTRWYLSLPLIGQVSVEHHDNCNVRIGMRCPKGWELHLPGNREVKLARVRTVEEAKKAALKRLRREVLKVLQVLPE